MKDISKIALYSALIFIGSIAIYFIFFLLPKTASIKKMSAVKSGLEESKLMLSENIVLYYSFLALDPTHQNFYEDRDILIAQLQKTQDKSLHYFSQSPEIISPGIFSTAKTRNLISDNNEVQSSVFEKSKNSLEKQNEIIENLSESDKTLGKLLAYQPIIDLSDIENKEVTSDRTQITITEITKIRQRVNQSNLHNKTSIVIDLDSVLASLDAFQTALGSGNDSLAVSRLDSLENDYKKLKNTAFASQAEIVKTENSLRALAEQDYLLTELQNLINEATDLQKDLSNDPLFNLLSLL